MTFKPTTAMVLAAGLGTRMRAGHDGPPKPMVRLDDKPLIDHVLDRLAAAGITRAVVNVHHKADLIEAHVTARAAGGGGPEIVLSDERRHLLDTGGGAKAALHHLGDAPFVVHNSDSVWREGEGANLDRLFAAWDDERMDVLLLLALGSASIGYDGRGDFSLEPDGHIRRRRETEVVPFVFAGVSIAHPRAFADTPDGAFSMNNVWNRAMLQGRAFGVRMEGIWMHVGTPEALADAQRAMAAARGR